MFTEDEWAAISSAWLLLRGSPQQLCVAGIERFPRRKRPRPGKKVSEPRRGIQGVQPAQRPQCSQKRTDHYRHRITRFTENGNTPGLPRDLRRSGDVGRLLWHNPDWDIEECPLTLC